MSIGSSLFSKLSAVAVGFLGNFQTVEEAFQQQSRLLLNKVVEKSGPSRVEIVYEIIMEHGVFEMETNRKLDYIIECETTTKTLS